MGEKKKRKTQKVGGRRGEKRIGKGGGTGRKNALKNGLKNFKKDEKRAQMAVLYTADYQHVKSIIFFLSSSIPGEGLGGCAVFTASHLCIGGEKLFFRRMTTNRGQSCLLE